MSDTIWIHYSRPRPHWYRLDDAERDRRLAEWAAIADAAQTAGATRLGCYHIRGQSDFQEVEIWTFRTAEDAFQHWAQLTAAGYNEWFAFANNVGMALDETDR